MDTITGPGVKHSYVYDSVNKRIVSRDGKKDEFVDCFDGRATEEQLHSLNTWDSDIMRSIKGDAQGNGLLDEMGKQAIEIKFTVEINDNGDMIWTFNYGGNEHTMLDGYTYPYADHEYENRNRFYKTEKHEDYNPDTNSISFAIGDSYDIAGMKFKISRDNFSVKDVNDLQQWKKAEPYACALSHLMLFVEGIWGAYVITDEDTPIALDFLEGQGVDTSKEFVVNGTRCNLVNGKIQEVGYERTDDHSSLYKIMQNSLKRSLIEMSKPLA